MENIQNLLEIILVTYNRKTQLKATLDQLTAEDSPIRNFEIKILDNCSTDGSSDLIDEYAAKFPNITHIRHKRNIGGNGNIARAFELSSKKYLWVLCDDDTYDWKAWPKIEKAMTEDYDVIFTQRVKNNIANMFYAGTFVPACIYKTENLTDTVVINMLDNIRNMFPHLAILAKNINENKKFYIVKRSIVLMGCNQDGIKTYIRGLEELSIPKSRRNMYWAIAYLNSIELIIDRKNQILIINGLKHLSKSLYGFFKIKITNNLLYYNHDFHNYYQMFRPLSFMQKIKFLTAFIETNSAYIFKDTRFARINGKEKWVKYFAYINQAEHLKKLAKKLKNKKVLIYGAGIVSELLFDDYDMSQFNIVGVADRKFINKTDKTYKGYKAISPEDINNYDFDVIVFAMHWPVNIAKNLVKHVKHKKMLSIIKKKFFVVL